MSDIEGPYSFKDVDGLKTPAYLFLPGGKRKNIGEVTVKVDGGMTFDVQFEEKYTDIETASFDVPMRYVYFNRPAKSKINWSYNCLTEGIHHGRPEAIWNMSLLQTTYMFTPRQFQVLAVDRIYSDALQFVDHGDGSFTKSAADKIKDKASPLVLNVYRKKIGELTKYYRSLQFKQDIDDAIRLNQMGKLNSNYQPLHSHDSINMLCRIVGVSCATEASKE